MAEEVVNNSPGGQPRRGANLAIVSGSTVASRVLGLGRDVLLYAVFGASALNSAFLLAFTLPNLLRRLFGEGALSSALVPVLAGSLEHHGREDTLRLLNRILTRVSAALLVLTAGCVLGLLLAATSGGLPDRWDLAARLAAWLFPYGMLVCLTALLAAALNVLGYFLLGSLAQLGVNLGILVALGGVGVWVTDDPGARMAFVLGGVLVGGVAQVALPAGGLWRQQWRPNIDPSNDPQLGELWRLFLPGVLGAAIYQVNAAVGQLLAFGVDAAGVAILYLANRLMQLPLGVFVIAVTTVAFPEISRQAARKDAVGFARAYREGAGLILAITLPAAAGLILLREPILSVLFGWGQFEASDVAATAPVLAVFAGALPFYALATMATRGFHAHRDTATPVRWSAISFGVNLVMSLALMGPLGVLGLALANAAAVLLQSVGLRAVLSRRHPVLRSHGRAGNVLRLLVATVWMAGVVLGGQAALELGGPATDGKPAALLAVVVLIPIGMGAYGLGLWLLRAPEIEPIQRWVMGRLHRS